MDFDDSHSASRLSPRPRRPRGFAATSAVDSSSATASSGVRREREKEKERTKLRERHRRAITSRILSGLRQHGNFPLPARADMNDVLAALAREAGWTVEPDGATYRDSTAISQFTAAAPQVGEDSLGGSAERFPAPSSPIGSSIVQSLDHKQSSHNVGEHGNGFLGTYYVPVYVTLSAHYIDNLGHYVNARGLREELVHLKSLDVDGIAVEFLWGIVEAWTPQKYNWTGYRELVNTIRDFNFKLQGIMVFHEYGGSDSERPLVSLPQWILEIGKENQEIFFTDREGRRNTECLSCSVDKERVLLGRTGIEVYSDFMRSFRTEFDELFCDGFLTSVEIGLGPHGELKYPSCSKRMGWSYPGIGEFQCYDKYSQQNLHKAATMRGHSFWARIPDNSGHYNSRPNETGFFCDRGDYDSYYGRFFLRWYAQVLIDHAENVLSLASLIFDDTNLVVKIPAAYWWYRSASHAAELTSGYYNPSNRDGYASVFTMLGKYSASIKIVCNGIQVPSHGNDALADPEGLNWQIINCAWDQGLGVAGVNGLSCFDKEAYKRVVALSKPKNDPDNHHFSFFVYQQPSPVCQGAICFSDLAHFVKCMHGEISGDDLLS